MLQEATRIIKWFVDSTASQSSSILAFRGDKRNNERRMSRIRMATFREKKVRKIEGIIKIGE